MPIKPVDPRCNKPVPAQYAGKWVAWNSDHTQIIAEADSMPSLWQRVRDLHVLDPVFEKIPRADVRFVGMR